MRALPASVTLLDEVTSPLSAAGRSRQPQRACEFSRDTVNDTDLSHLTGAALSPGHPRKPQNPSHDIPLSEDPTAGTPDSARKSQGKEPAPTRKNPPSTLLFLQNQKCQTAGIATRTKPPAPDIPSKQPATDSRQKRPPRQAVPFGNARDRERNTGTLRAPISHPLLRERQTAEQSAPPPARNDISNPIFPVNTTNHVCGGIVAGPFQRGTGSASTQPGRTAHAFGIACPFSNRGRHRERTPKIADVGDSLWLCSRLVRGRKPPR